MRWMTIELEDRIDDRRYILRFDTNKEIIYVDFPNSKEDDGYMLNAHDLLEAIESLEE